MVLIVNPNNAFCTPAHQLSVPATLFLTAGVVAFTLDVLFFQYALRLKERHGLAKWLSTRFEALESGITLQDVATRRREMTADMYNIPIPSSNSIYLSITKSVSELFEQFVTRFVILTSLVLVVVWSCTCFVSFVPRMLATNTCVSLILVATSSPRNVRHIISAMFFGLLFYTDFVLICVVLLSGAWTIAPLTIATTVILIFFAKPSTTYRIRKLPFDTKQQQRTKLRYIFWHEMLFGLAETVLGITFVVAMYAV